MYLIGLAWSIFYLFLNVHVPFLGNNAQNITLASHGISLEKRYNNEFVNKVFKDNILLSLAYMDGDVKKASDINWDKIEKPFTYQFTLKPSESFAFHDNVESTFKASLAKTTNAHFTYDEGFKDDGYLAGDGVCHLASVIYWAAKDANLEALAPTSHDFMPIPEVPRAYGVSIYSNPQTPSSNSLQNLYITNNFKEDVIFLFKYDGNILNVSVLEKGKDIALSI